MFFIHCQNLTVSTAVLAGFVERKLWDWRIDTDIIRFKIRKLESETLPLFEIPVSFFCQVHIFISYFRRRERRQRAHAWSSSGKMPAHSYLSPEECVSSSWSLSSLWQISVSRYRLPQTREKGAANRPSSSRSFSICRTKKKCFQSLLRFRWKGFL